MDQYYEEFDLSKYIAIFGSLMELKARRTFRAITMKGNK